MADPTSAQEAVRTAGTYLWRAFLSDHQATGLRLACNTLVRSEAVEVQSRSLRVWDLFTHGSEFAELLLDRRLQTVCWSLLGPGYLLSDYSLNSVYPNAQPDPWHVDYPYNETKLPIRCDAPLGLQCVIPIDEFTRSNGATEYRPGSHQPDDSDGMTKRSDLPTASFEGRPGDLLIMHAATEHRAGVNNTTKLRSGLVLSFVQRWVRPIVSPRTIAATVDDTTPEDLRVLLGAVVFEEIDSKVVRREAI